jgi:hypothetical protein
MSYNPFENPAGGPNFYKFGEAVLYTLNIDNNGDAAADITYQFKFSSQVRNPNTFLYNTGPIKAPDDATRNQIQTYQMARVDSAIGTRFVAGPMTTMPDNVGAASTPAYGANGSGVYEYNDTVGKGRVFAGQTDDAFFLDLRVFDLLYGGNLSEVGTDTLAGFNVHTIALQVPKAAIRGPNPIIGAWMTAFRPSIVTRTPGGESGSGTFIQVSRLGMPLVNEVVIPLGQKDNWNGSKPADDGQFLNYVTDPELPKLLQAIYSIPAPSTPRNDLVQVFLTGVPGLNQPPGVKPAEMLRLNTDVLPSANPSRLGVLGGDPAGFPNGRRLIDDVIDIELQAVAGALTGANVSTLGDGVNGNDVEFRSTFPYVAFPHSGSRPWKLNPNPIVTP